MPRAPQVEEAITLIQGDSNKVMGLSVGPHETVEPGKYIPRAEAQKPPKLALPSSVAPTGAAKYVAACIDLDAPFASFPVLGPILHWVQGDLTASGGSELVSTATPTCEYAPPGPPPGAGPHRYVFLLYAQPASFDLNMFKATEGKVGVSGRMRFDYKAFAERAGLGEVVAANYFTSN